MRLAYRRGSPLLMASTCKAFLTSDAQWRPVKCLS